MVQMISNRPLTGDYGSIGANQHFTCTEPVAESLEKRGLARRIGAVAPSTESSRNLVERIRARAEEVGQSKTVQPEKPVEVEEEDAPRRRRRK